MGNKVIAKKVVVPPDKYHETHLKMINQLLPKTLTNKEIELLAYFMSVDEAIIEGDRFNPLIRKNVKERFKLTSGALSNHLNSLQKKGFISKNEITNRLTIKDFLFPHEEVQEYKILLTQQVNE